MRRVPIFALVTMTALVAARASADTAVQVVVSNVTKQEGVLLAGAYPGPETWLGATTVASQDIPVVGNVRDGVVRFEMRLPPGRYALSVLQDLNGNRKLDTNFLGIPTEPSGSSNDAPARWSAPKFRDAAFTVGDAPLELKIRLN